MADSNNIFGVIAEQLVIPPGATLAVLMTGNAGQCSEVLKYYSGGTLQILGVTVGTTLTAAQLVSAGNSGGYIFGTSEALTVDGAARYYLMATGATCVVMHLRGLTAGF